MRTQTSFDDLGTPLSDVTFCVLDLETTGGSPTDCAITEVGAVKVLRGEVVGTFHTLVNPGRPVPAFIRLLTGITDELLIEAPAIEAVLPNLLEFLRDTVLVAHNARFDVGFLNAALERAAYPRLNQRVVDTAGLARRVLSGEVPNHRLDTLARHLRCAHQPCHRAYADVLATIDVLHHLIERVAGYGVTTLEDLVAISSTRMDGTFGKISLADDIPSAIGVYRFLGAHGQTLYVGKASDLRKRVRSYFYGDPRRKIRDLLRETQTIDVERHETLLEAEVAEARSIATDLPPYNRSGKKAGEWYVKASIGKTSTVSTTRVVKPDDRCTYIGPFASMAAARTFIDGLRDALKLHRCARPSRCNGCAFADMGRCAGTDRDAHRAEVEQVVHAAGTDPNVALTPLLDRMARLARQERFEEAAEVRDRGALLERTLVARLRTRALVDAGDIVLGIGARAVLIHGGRLAGALSFAPGAERIAVARLLAQTGESVDPRAARAEHAVISSWLSRGVESARLLYVSRTFATPVGARPVHRFKPRS